jgi:DNA-directed RNA polymerase subunit beta'
MLLGLFILTMENRRGIYANRYPLKNKSSKYSKKLSLLKIPYFHSYEDVYKAHQQKKINSHSILWLRWQQTFQMITTTVREHPIEIRYEVSGNSCTIYEHYQLRKNKEQKIIGIYICTTTGRVLFNQQIDEVVQGIFEASPKQNISM